MPFLVEPRDTHPLLCPGRNTAYPRRLQILGVANPNLKTGLAAVRYMTSSKMKQTGKSPARPIVVLALAVVTLKHSCGDRLFPVHEGTIPLLLKLMILASVVYRQRRPGYGNIITWTS